MSGDLLHMLYSVLKYLAKRKKSRVEEKSLFERALRCYDGGSYLKTRVLLEDLITQSPQHAQGRNLLGACHMALQEIEAAIRNFDLALALEPSNPDFLNNRGQAFQAVGEFGAARQSYLRALDVNTCFGPALLNWASAGPARDGNTEQIRRMALNLIRNPVSRKDTIYAHFALAKIHDDHNEFDQAFMHFRIGNEGKWNASKFDLRRTVELSTNIKRIFDKINLSSRAVLATNTVPIFVIGMPRSGTTLVERMLRQLSGVHPGGELTLLPDSISAVSKELGVAYPDNIPALGVAGLNRYAAYYRDGAQRRFGQDSLVVDKYPFNFFHVGLIKILFPNAKIIHCKRHPLDVCLSNYFRYYTYGNGFSYDIETLCAYYGMYADLMDHWHLVLPDASLEIKYEELIQDPEAGMRKLKDYLGLEVGGGHAPSDLRADAIFTASAWQVRQPIYHSSVHRWKRYGDNVTPFINALEKSRVPVL